MTGRWSESIARTQELGPCGTASLAALAAPIRLGRAAEVLKQMRAADAEHGALLPESGGTSRVLTLAVAGEREEAAFEARLYATGRRLAAGEVAHHQMYDLACTEAQLGHVAQAVGWLRKAATSGFPSYLMFQRDPLLGPIRSDPGFQQLMAELKPNWERWTATYH
jgi:hypothetical protein